MASQLEAPEEMTTPSAADKPVSQAPAADLRRRAVRGGTILIGTRFLIQLGQWAVTLIVARLLLPYDYGLLTGGMIVVGLADLLAEAGVGRALIQKRTLEPGDVAEGFTITLLLS